MGCWIHQVVCGEGVRDEVRPAFSEQLLKVTTYMEELVVSSSLLFYRPGFLHNKNYKRELGM